MYYLFLRRILLARQKRHVEERIHEVGERGKSGSDRIDRTLDGNEPDTGQGKDES